MRFDSRNILIAPILAGILGALILVGLFGRSTYKIGPIDARLSISPAVSGETRINVPPLGDIIAKTHATPISLQVTVEQASVDKLRTLLAGRQDGGSLTDDLKSGAMHAAFAFGARLFALIFVGGCLGVLAFGAGRGVKPVLLGGFSSTGIAFLILVITAATFSVNALKTPKYTGMLEATPMIAKIVKGGLVNVDRLDERIQSTASSIYRLENSLGSFASPDEAGDQIRILAVSDLHNNPFGMKFAREIAQMFNVDMVLDAGDLTDFGSNYENDLGKQLDKFGCPHVFVTGNHDSLQTVSELKKLKNTCVLDQKAVKLKGLQILGQSDPASCRIGGTRIPLASASEISRASRKLSRMVSGMSKRPDILLVHEPNIARKFVGKVPIIISGHDHFLATSNVKGTTWVRPGSTGASGIRYFAKSIKGKDITAAIIYVDRSPKVRATAVDLIDITSPKGEFVITRKKF